MSAFSVLQEDAVRALIALWGSDRIVLVGGAALAVLTGMPWRTTLDIDLVVTVETEASIGALALLADWRRDPDHEPRWVYRGTALIDVLPVTPSALRSGELRWPRSGFAMSTAGMELAGERAVRIDLSDGTALRVAPLPAIVLLKMVSFLDRPHDRTRDLVDVAWILHTHVADMDERRFDPRLGGLDIRYDEGSAFALGEDLWARAAVHAPLVERFLRTIGR
jgi:predicted nucleotidyltransferase